MERYIYLDNKIIVFIITDPIFEDNLKNKEINPYKIYNITRAFRVTKIIKIFDFHTKEEFNKIDLHNRKYILNDSLVTDYINYKDRFEYYTSMDSLISHNYQKLYKNKEITGLYKIYDKEGHLIEEYYHNNFLKEGEYKVYNENGMIIINEYYINGIKNGICKEYYDNGNLINILKYNNGEKIESEEYNYDITSILQHKKIKKFKNNEIIYELYIHRNGSYSKKYYENNNFIVETGTYKDNDIFIKNK